MHLGHLVSFGGGCLEDVKSRSLSANIVFRRLRATLLRNAALTVEERVYLVRSLVHSLCYGAGLWVPSNRSEQEAIQRAFMVHWRQSCRLLCGVGSKFLTDDEVCAALGVAPPAAIMVSARLRQLDVVLRHGPGFLWKTLEAEQGWLSLVKQDIVEALQLLDVHIPAQTDWDGLQDLLPLQPQLSNWARRYTALAAHNSASLQSAALAKARALFRFEQLGGIQLKVPMQGSRTWCCEHCGRVCSTKAALAVHKSIAHGQKALTASAAGATCAVCHTHWWSTARLRQHVWRSPACASTYGHADLPTPEDFEIQGNRKELAWRRPPVPAFGPATWWSTLSPDIPVPTTQPYVAGRPDTSEPPRKTCAADVSAWAQSALTWVCANDVQDSFDPQVPPENSKRTARSGSLEHSASSESGSSVLMQSKLTDVWPAGTAETYGSSPFAMTSLSLCSFLQENL